MDGNSPGEARDGIHLSALRSGVIYDRSSGVYPTRVYGWGGSQCPLALQGVGNSFFGLVLEGPVTLSGGGNRYRLNPRQYFCMQDALELDGGAGIVVERVGYSGLNLVGGPVEDRGRLKYIDGCTDTLLVPPVKRGDACLNALFFPAGTDQTLHTHPSIRAGVVLGGAGVCRTARATYDLQPGQVFIIEPEAIHGFHTDPDEEMLVIAYHPDSDFGPVDEDHPMINRTIVDGVSAAMLEDIRTR